MEQEVVWSWINSQKNKAFFVQGIKDIFLEELANYNGQDQFIFLTLSNPLLQELPPSVIAYNVFDLSGISRDFEIKAYEKAHELLHCAFDKLPPHSLEIAHLNVDEDLTILALYFFFANAIEHLEKIHPGKKYILIQKNNNTTFRILQHKHDLTFIQMNKTSDSYQIYNNIDCSENITYNEKITKKNQLEFKDFLKEIPQLINCFKPNSVLIAASRNSAHFSFLEIIKIAKEIVNQEKDVVIMCNNEKIANDYKKYDFHTFCLPNANKFANDLYLLLQQLPVFNFNIFPYNYFKNFKSWLIRLNRQLVTIEMYKIIFDILKPSSILLGQYGSSNSRTLQYQAFKENVPIYGITFQGFAGHARGMPIIHPKVKFCVYGTQAIDALQAFNFPKQNIILTGNTRFDSVPYYKTQQEKYRNKILTNHPGFNTLILVATTGIFQLDKTWMYTLSEISPSLGLLFLVKPHPSLGIPPYKDIVGHLPHCVLTEDDLDELTTACDAVITDFSSTGWHAIMYNKPLIIVNMSKKEFDFRWENRGMGTRVSDIDSLKEQLFHIQQKTFDSKVLVQQLKSVNEYNYMNDGHATERVVAELCLK